MTTTGTTTTRRSALVALAVTCAVLLVALYVVAVRTEFGQRADNATLRGRTTDAVVQHAVDRTLDSVSVTSLFLATMALVVLALLRRRPLLAVGIGVLVLGANVTTQVLKDALTRPDLLGPETARATSGHVPERTLHGCDVARARLGARGAGAAARAGWDRGNRVRPARGRGDAHGRVAPAERRAGRLPRDPRVGGGSLPRGSVAPGEPTPHNTTRAWSCSIESSSRSHCSSSWPQS